MSRTQEIDYKRLAELDQAVREAAARLGFYIAEISINDDRESEWPPKVEIVLRQEETK